MGKMKNIQIDNWVEEEQEKYLNDKHREISIVYADLLDFDCIHNSSRIYISMINGKTYDFTPNDIIQLNALSIKIEYGISMYLVLPLDKIVSVKYVK